MSKETVAPYIFPAALIGRSDLARLVREVETIDNDLEAQKVRNPDSKNGYSLPTMSRGMTDFLEQNKIDVSNDRARMEFKEHLRALKDKAPVIHMTFAVEADPDFLQKLTAWIRQEVHPQALLSVGLQPSLVGGVYMRTPNHIHDFSLKALLKGKRDVMINELEGALRASVAAPATVQMIAIAPAEAPHEG